MSSEPKTALDYYNEAFNRWLRSVKSEAWDEGYAQGEWDHCDAGAPCDGPTAAESNPYEEKPKSDKGNRNCGAQNADFYCTRERWHTGPHVAGTCNLHYAVCDVWEDKK